MSNKLQIFFIDLIAAIFIFLYIYTSISKIITHWSFESVLSRLPFINSFSKQVAWIIPSLELMLALLLFLPSTRRIGLLCSALLTAVFTLYIGYMIFFIPHLPCSCGGILNSLSWSQHLILNVTLTILGFTGWKISSPDKDFIAINRISRTPA